MESDQLEPKLTKLGYQRLSLSLAQAALRDAIRHIVKGDKRSAVNEIKIAIKILRGLYPRGRTEDK